MGDGDGEARAEEACLGVGRHVVVALEGMLIIGLALRYKMVEDALHVAAHVGVGVFVDRQRSRGVLYEKVEQPHTGQLSELAHHLAGHQMEAAPTRLKLYFNLSPHKYSSVMNCAIDFLFHCWRWCGITIDDSFEFTYGYPGLGGNWSQVNVSVFEEIALK